MLAAGQQYSEGLGLGLGLGFFSMFFELPVSSHHGGVMP